MVTVHIREVAEQRGITTAYQLQKALGISPTGASKLWKGNFEQIGLVTIDKLCRVLKCQPGRLIKYAADVEQ